MPQAHPWPPGERPLHESRDPCAGAVDSPLLAVMRIQPAAGGTLPQSAAQADPGLQERPELVDGDPDLK